MCLRLLQVLQNEAHTTFGAYGDAEEREMRIVVFTQKSSLLKPFQ